MVQAQSLPTLPDFQTLLTMEFDEIWRNVAPSAKNPNDVIIVQSRAQMDYTKVDLYGEMMEEGTTFDPCYAVQDLEGKIYVPDGAHRTEAGRKSGTIILYRILEGTKKDAEWLATKANAKHGIQRTREDLQRQIKLALLHDNGVVLSNRQIARWIGCSHNTIKKVRKELVSSGQLDQMEDETRTVTRGDQTYQMDISGLQEEKVKCEGCGKFFPPEQITEFKGRKLHTDCYYAALETTKWCPDCGKSYTFQPAEYDHDGYFTCDCGKTQRPTQMSWEKPENPLYLQIRCEKCGNRLPTKPIVEYLDPVTYNTLCDECRTKLPKPQDKTFEVEVQQWGNMAEIEEEVKPAAIAATIEDLEKILADEWFYIENDPERALKSLQDIKNKTPSGKHVLSNIYNQLKDAGRILPGQKHDVRQACWNLLEQLQAEQSGEEQANNEQPTRDFGTCAICHNPLTGPGNFGRHPNGAICDVCLANQRSQPEPEFDFSFNTSDRNKIMQAGLKLIRPSWHEKELKIYSPQKTAVVAELLKSGNGTWKHFETFDTKKAMKERCKELGHDPQVIFESHEHQVEPPTISAEWEDLSDEQLKEAIKAAKRVLTRRHRPQQEGNPGAQYQDSSIPDYLMQEPASPASPETERVADVPAASPEATSLQETTKEDVTRLQEILRSPDIADQRRFDAIHTVEELGMKTLELLGWPTTSESFYRNLHTGSLCRLQDFLEPDPTTGEPESIHVIIQHWEPQPTVKDFCADCEHHRNRNSKIHGKTFGAYYHGKCIREGGFCEQVATLINGYNIEQQEAAEKPMPAQEYQ